jgi:hypothetical protein
MDRLVPYHILYPREEKPKPQLRRRDLLQRTLRYHYLTQMAAAKELDLTHTYISHLIAGRQPLTEKARQSFLRVFGEVQFKGLFPEE